MFNHPKSACALLLALPLASCAAAAPAEIPLPKPPAVVKKGTVDLDLCETSPFVFKGKLYRLELHRNAHRLRIMDHGKQEEISHFGDKHRFPCVFVEGDTVYVYGTKEDRGWYGNTVTVFTSKDLVNWNEQVGFSDKDYGICNLSVCKSGDRYLMSIEVNWGSKENNGGFGCRFLESKDLVRWTATPRECRQWTTGSPHLLRHHDGWHYLFSTVFMPKYGYVLILNRSRDLIAWEPSPFNPIMHGEDADKVIFNRKLTPEQREKVAKAKNIDNSDIDFIDHEGKLVINYCWGNQHGTEFIAEAEYACTTAQYLEAWFPDPKPWAGIDVTQPLSTFAKDRATYGQVVSAAGATVTTSSGDSKNLPALLSGVCTAPFAFHTTAETNPWVTLDLGRTTALTGILVRNRTDAAKERAATLRLQASDDGKTWRELWKAAGASPSWEIPLLSRDIKARYLRLDTQPDKPTPLHLQHVEVWGKR